MTSVIDISAVSFIATKLAVDIVSINLGYNASFNIYTYDKNMNMIISLRGVCMTPEEYSLWTDNDQYVYDWALNKLQTTIITDFNSSLNLENEIL